MKFWVQYLLQAAAFSKTAWCYGGGYFHSRDSPIRILLEKRSQKIVLMLQYEILLELGIHKISILEYFHFENSSIRILLEYPWMLPKHMYSTHPFRSLPNLGPCNFSVRLEYFKILLVQIVKPNIL